MMNVPEFARLPQAAYPFYGGAPRHYRFDGDRGLFLVGSETEADHLWIQPMFWRWASGERWRRDRQEWLDVAFVDADHVASSISLKKSAAVNLFDWLMRFQSGKVIQMPVKPDAVWMKLVPVEKETIEGDRYFTLTMREWNFASEEQVHGALMFWHSGLFEWILPGEVNQ